MRHLLLTCFQFSSCLVSICPSGILLHYHYLPVPSPCLSLVLSSVRAQVLLPRSPVILTTFESHGLLTFVYSTHCTAFRQLGVRHCAPSAALPLLPASPAFVLAAAPGAPPIFPSWSSPCAQLDTPGVSRFDIIFGKIKYTRYDVEIQCSFIRDISISPLNNALQQDEIYCCRMNYIV